MNTNTLFRTRPWDLEEVKRRVRTKDSPEQFIVSREAYTFPINGNGPMTWGQWEAGVYYFQIGLTVFGPLGPWSVPGLGVELTISQDGTTYKRQDFHPGVGTNKTLMAGAYMTAMALGVNITNWVSTTPDHYGRLFFRLIEGSTPPI